MTAERHRYINHAQTKSERLVLLTRRSHSYIAQPFFYRWIMSCVLIEPVGVRSTARYIPAGIVPE